MATVAPVTDIDAATGRPARPSRARRFFVRQRGLFVCLGVIAVANALLNASLLRHGHLSDALMTSGGDVAEQVWFLGWLPHALLHGLNPFVSHALFAGSGGVNLMVNTSIFFPALALAPVTLVGGPVLAFNVGVLLVPVVCAWPMYALARRFTPSSTLATVATLLWSLSPYVVSNLASGHFHQTVTFFPPLVLVLVLDLVGDRRSAVRTGVVGGLAIVAQFFTGSELLAMTALEAVGGVVLLACWRPAYLVATWRRAVTALAVAVAVAVVLLSVPLWFEFVGPRHVTGKPWGDLFDTGVYLKGFVYAPVGLGHGSRLVNLWYSGNATASEPISYLGWGLVVAAVATVIRWWRDVTVRLLGAAAVVTAVLALGVNVQLSGPTSVLSSWAPWRLFVHLPIFEQLIPSRLAQPLGFVVVLLVLLGAERGRRRLAASRPSWRVVITSVALGLVLVPQAVAANAPFPSFSVSGYFEPAFFAHYGANPGPHARLLVFPTPTSGLGNLSAPMVYQARSRFSYDLVDGYLLVPTTNSTESAWRYPPQGDEGLLQNFVTSFQVATLTTAQRNTVARVIRTRGVTTVALAPLLADENRGVAEITAVVGTTPHRFGGVVWWDVTKGVQPLTISPSAMAHCVATTNVFTPRLAGLCVLHAAGR